MKVNQDVRLPTEAQWEYAAREGGKEVRFGNGKLIANPEEINFNGEERYKKPYSLSGIKRQKTVPVFNDARFVDYPLLQVAIIV